MISASLVKELRDKTGAGMLDCKKALEATNANIDAAIDWLREKGISKAAKQADRIAAEGVAAVIFRPQIMACLSTRISACRQIRQGPWNRSALQSRLMERLIRPAS